MRAVVWALAHAVYFPKNFVEEWTPPQLLPWEVRPPGRAHSGSRKVVTYSNLLSQCVFGFWGS